MIKTYSEMLSYPTFESRFEYLKLDAGHIGDSTFGYDRYLNQVFYRSPEWRSIRRKVIMRDNGCDMGLEDYLIPGRIIIHHLNPLVLYDIENRTNKLLDPEFLVCVSFDTHNAIHWGDISFAQRFNTIERKPNDTCPWR